MSNVAAQTLAGARRGPPARRRLRVAVVTSFPADCSVPRGGVEAVSVNLVRALARLPDLEIHVITTDPACRSPVRYPWENAEIHRLPWREKRVLVHALGARSAMQDYLTGLQPNVIHAHDLYGIMVKGMPVPRVFTIHGFIHADTLQARDRLAWLRSRIWRRLELANWADQPHVISISPYVRERLRDVTAATIHDIENPIAEDFFHVERRETRGTIFCAALISPRKNILGVIEALDQIIQAGVKAQLRVAGGSYDLDYETQLRDFIRVRNLADSVKLLGPISQAGMCEELSRAAVFALTSFEEGAPMVVAEALAAGVPVVTSNRCGMPYMVRDGECGFLVNPRDPRQIARRLYSVLEDPELRERMSRNARAAARDRFRPDRVAARTREVYFQAVEEYHDH